jgi:hypothetical protein
VHHANRTKECKDGGGIVVCGSIAKGGGTCASPAIQIGKKRQAEQRMREERIEPELVAATAHQGRYATIHNTRATLGEKLPEGLIRSRAGFLLKVVPVKAKVDVEKVKKEMALLERVAVIAYFVGGQQSPKSLRDWLADLSKEVQEDL